MATNGIVSIVRDGRVVLKAIAGCDGYNAEKVREAVEHHLIGQGRSIDATGLAGICKRWGFGCDDCLVIQSESGLHFQNDIEELGPLYRDPEKFNNPEFNPRWECGLASHVEIVNAGSQS